MRQIFCFCSQKNQRGIQRRIKGAEDSHFPDESQLEVAYFQKMLTTVVSEVDEEITQTLNIPVQGKGKQKEII